MSFISGLVCTGCGKHLPQLPLRQVCPKCGKFIQIHYDLTAVSNTMSRGVIGGRPGGIWRFKELLPVRSIENMVSLGEGGTFLHRCDRLAREQRLPNLYLKDETINPTGSFIDRGMAVEISMTRERNISRVSCGSAGNLGVSLAAYAARAEIVSKIIMAKSDVIDMGKFYQIVAYGAKVEMVRTHDEIESALRREGGTCHVVSSTSPYFLEGIKTTIFEIVEQLNWSFPDWIIVPMGSGGHMTQIWKGVSELRGTGLCEDDPPRLIGVQSNSCSPITRAYTLGVDEVPPWDGVSGIAHDIGISSPRCGTTALKAIRESGGLAMSVDDGLILDAVRQLARLEGVFAEPASATVIAALNDLVGSGTIASSDTVVCIITGMGLKAPEVARDLVRDRVGLQRLLSNIEGRKFTGVVGKSKRRILEILLQGESYGYEIWKRLADDFGIRVKIPSVYQHLGELKAAGLIIQTRTERTYQGKDRAYYALTDRGRHLVGNL